MAGGNKSSSLSARGGATAVALACLVLNMLGGNMVPSAPLGIKVAERGMGAGVRANYTEGRVVIGWSAPVWFDGGVVAAETLAAVGGGGGGAEVGDHVGHGEDEGPGEGSATAWLGSVKTLLFDRPRDRRDERGPVVGGGSVLGTGVDWGGLPVGG